MPGIEKAIHAEIRKALRKLPQITRLEKRISSLTKLVKQQRSSLSKARVTSARRGPAVSPSPKGWRADSVRATRHMLGISQGAMAKLLDASLNSVSGWETGRTEPRLKAKEKILALRKLSASKVQTVLKKSGASMRRKRAGRKAAKTGLSKAPSRTARKGTRRRAKAASARPAHRSSGKRKATRQ